MRAAETSAEDGVDGAAPLKKRAAHAAKAAAAVAALADEDEEVRYRPIDRALLRRTLGLLAPWKKWYALGLSLGIGQTVLEMMSPKFTQWIINYGDGYRKRTLSPFPPTQAAAIGHVVWLVAIWAIVMVCAIVLQRFTILVMTGAGEQVQFGIRRSLFEQLQRLSMSYYDRTKLGRIISRCTSDVNAMRDVNVWGIHTVLINAIQMLIAGSHALHDGLAAVSFGRLAGGGALLSRIRSTSAGRRFSSRWCVRGGRASPPTWQKTSPACAW